MCVRFHSYSIQVAELLILHVNKKWNLFTLTRQMICFRNVVSLLRLWYNIWEDAWRFDKRKGPLPLSLLEWPACMAWTRSGSNKAQNRSWRQVCPPASQNVKESLLHFPDDVPLGEQILIVVLIINQL